MPDPVVSMQELQDGLNANVMTTIYEKVNDLLGAGNQLFAMEFPARPLNPRNYEHQVDDCYSTLTKPYPVQEAEFLLSDQMYDVSPIVQGPNGEKLSNVFSTVLNNYVPKLEALKSFVHDQKNLRAWLMEPVEDEVAGQVKTLSRMAMAKELYAEYLAMRNKWLQEKNEKYDNSKREGELEQYANWLSTEGLVRDEEINNFYNDAIVRGNYHEVLTLLGFLNVSSPSEVLEQTKQKMRGSVRRSLDGSSDIYPVQFQPSDWFKSLRPNISPKDLTMATESLVNEYRGKQKRLAALQAQLAEQAVIEISKEERDRLESEIANCEAQVSSAEQNLITTYGNGAVSAVKAVIDIYKATADPVENAKSAITKVQQAADKKKLEGTEKSIYGIIGDLSKDVVDNISKTYKAQAAVIQKLKQLTDTRMAFAEAKVKDRQLFKLRLEEQIKSVQADLDFLTPLVTGSVGEKANATDKEKDEGTLMTTAGDDVEDNNFMDVIIKAEDMASSSQSASSASSSQSSWGVGGWFWSGSSQQSQSAAVSEERKKDLASKVEIGFRVKKITIERGGWFNPNIFKLSNNYYRLADIRFSKGVTKDDVQKISQSKREISSQLKKLVTYKVDDTGKDVADNAEGSNISTLDYIMPAFPTGFVIAKDITIRIEASASESNSLSQYMESNQSSGGGIFCFRGNSSSSSKSQNESAYFGSTSKYFYIRIPGPQILGWFLQFTPGDNAEPYKELDPEMYAQTLKSLMPELQEVANLQPAKTKDK